MTVVALDLTRDSRHRTAAAAGEVAELLSWLKLEGKAPRTLDDVERTWAVLLRQNPESQFAEFDVGQVTQVLLSFPQDSRRTRRSHLSTGFRHAVRMGWIDRNPLDLIPTFKGARQTVPPIFSEAEVALLYSDPLMTLLLDTGIRKSEARSLQRRHISLDREELVVYRGKGGKDRVIPLTVRVLVAIADLDLLEPLSPEEYLWYSRPGGGTVVARDRPVGNGTFHRWWVSRLEAAGVAYESLDTKRNRGPHTARHTFATRCLRAGIPLQEVSMFLGHASVKTTFDLYAHLDLADLRRDIRLLETV